MLVDIIRQDIRIPQDDFSQFKFRLDYQKAMMRFLESHKGTKYTLPEAIREIEQYMKEMGYKCKSADISH